MIAPPHPPRDYQARAISMVNETLDRLAAANKRRSVVLVMPTGAGKTYVGAHFCLRPGRTLWIAPSDDLVRQTRAAVGWLGDRAPQVVTMQQLQTWLRKGKTLPSADRVILDEGRCGIAERWTEVIRYYLEHGAELIVLDATPATAQGQGLGNICEELIDVISMRECIDRGYLVPFRVFGPYRELEAMARPIGKDPVSAAEAPVAWWLEYQHATWIRPTARGLWFGQSVKHAEGIADAFTAHGILAEPIHASTTKTRRIELLERVAEGDLRVLVCPELLRQGIDIPQIEVIGLARRVGSFPLRQQAVGRGARRCPEIGKRECLVFDLYGTTARLGLPDQAVKWSLAGEAARTLEALPPVTHCPNCLAWYPPTANRICPACQRELPPPPDPRTEVQKLQEIRRTEETDAEKFAALVGFVHRANANGYKPWWALHIYIGKYGQRPPHGWMQAAIKQAAAERPRLPALTQ